MIARTGRGDNDGDNEERRKATEEKSGEVDDESGKEALPSFKHLTGHIKRVIYASARTDKAPLLYAPLLMGGRLFTGL